MLFLCCNADHPTVKFNVGAHLANVLFVCVMLFFLCHIVLSCVVMLFVTCNFCCCFFVMQISPQSGPVQGGTLLTLSGTNFGSRNSQEVTVGNTTCQVRNVSSTR